MGIISYSLIVLSSLSKPYTIRNFSLSDKHGSSRAVVILSPIKNPALQGFIITLKLSHVAYVVRVVQHPGAGLDH